MTTKKRVLSGMRPTGPLHLGNLHGALLNWVNMQDDYDCYFFIADWHALTSDYEDPSNVPDHVKTIMVDWLSAGLSPDKSTLFVQSNIKEHAELFPLHARMPRQRPALPGHHPQHAARRRQRFRTQCRTAKTPGLH